MEFDGIWKDGEIEEGKNVIWRRDEKSKRYEMIIQYNGKFKDFNFHGEGEKIYYSDKGQKEKEKGNFRSGSLIDEDMLRMSFVPPDQHHD